MEQAAADKAEAFKEYIGGVIKRYRKYRGYRQSWLARDLGIAEATISRYEKGKSEIKASTMAHISHIFDFDLIEYIPFDETTMAQKFQKMTYMCNITPCHGKTVAGQKIRQGSLRNIRFMDVMPDGRTLFSATAGEDTEERRSKPKQDILTDMPKTQPLPLCDDDDRAFELHMAKERNRDRLRILLYGYRLMKLFQEMDTPNQTTSSMARQIIRRLIKTASGEVDQEVYGYYWKCVYYSK